MSKITTKIKNFIKILNQVNNIKNDIKKSKIAILTLTACFFTCCFYPSNTSYYSSIQKNHSPVIDTVDGTLRFVNNTAQFLIPMVLMDKVGLVQSAYVIVASSALTYGFKLSLNNVTILGTKIGQRPNGDPKNMPSGHSSLASSGMFFIIRRYGYMHAIYLVPITILTMLARLELAYHTISAVIAGCTLGIIVSIIFTSKYRKSY